MCVCVCVCVCVYACVRTCMHTRIINAGSKPKHKIKSLPAKGTFSYVPIYNRKNTCTLSVNA